jgi:hypothetical protein
LHRHADDPITLPMQTTEVTIWFFFTLIVPWNAPAPYLPLPASAETGFTFCKSSASANDQQQTLIANPSFSEGAPRKLPG